MSDLYSMNDVVNGLKKVIEQRESTIEQLEARIEGLEKTLVSVAVDVAFQLPASEPEEKDDG